MALRDATNTPCRIRHPPSHGHKISSPDNGASPTHDFYIKEDDAEDDGSYFLSEEPPPSITSLDSSTDMAAPLQQQLVQFAAVHESGEHFLDTIKQKVKTAQQGWGRKISRL